MNVYQHPTENRTFYRPDREPSLVLSVPVARITVFIIFLYHGPLLEGHRQTKHNRSLLRVWSGRPRRSASDMRTAYYGGTTLTGVGQVVALVEFDGYDISDVNLSFSSVGQSYSVPVQNILLDGATGAKCQFITSCLLGDSEEVLDIVQAIGMAPGRNQFGVFRKLRCRYFQQDRLTRVSQSRSVSRGSGETKRVGMITYFGQMAAQGQTIFAASGDWGVYPVIEGAFPAEDANVTAVGGTTLDIRMAWGVHGFRS